jgi:hypothetical protein
VSDRAYVDRLLDASTALVGAGGVAALGAAVLIGRNEVGLGILYGALGLILAAMVLVAVELYAEVAGLARSMARSARSARDRRQIERLRRQRRLNAFAVEFGHASARGLPIQQAWDEAVARCFPRAGLTA